MKSRTTIALRASGMFLAGVLPVPNTNGRRGDVGRSYVELRRVQLRLNIAEKNIKTQQDTL